MAKLKMIKKMIQSIRDIWLIVGISVFLFALLEGACSFTFLVMDHVTASNTRMFDSRAQADDYRKIPWSEDYFKEFNESSALRWEPYVYWRRKPYNSKYIKVNTDGFRVTPNSEISSENAQPSLRLFMFGGSTMWGTGARDALTIPALLATELRSRGIKVEVVNFGETGYVSTQEVITLLLQLQKGNIPNLVVFYDGGNDTYSAYQQGIAGLPQNEYNRAKEFNLTKRLPEIKRIVVKDTINNLATVRFTKALLRRIGMRKTEQKDEPDYDKGRIVEEAVNLYLNNLELVKSLAVSYKFKYIFYWQPTIFGKNKLSDYEKAEYAREQHLEKFFKETHNILREKTTHPRYEKTFYDLSAIFSHVEEPVYIDWIHLSERGNATIAQAMVEQILYLIPSANGGLPD